MIAHSCMIDSDKASELYRPITAAMASIARCRGAARPCSHSCKVRFEIRIFIAASLCDKSFLSRHSQSRSLKLFTEEADERRLRRTILRRV